MTLLISVKTLSSIEDLYVHQSNHLNKWDYQKAHKKKLTKQENKKSLVIHFANNLLASYFCTLSNEKLDRSFRILTFLLADSMSKNWKIFIILQQFSEEQIFRKNIKQSHKQRAYQIN